MSRLSFRPRPLDIHKKLPIVKSVKDLDNDEAVIVSRTALHTHNLVNLDNEPVSFKRRSEIPTPQFVIVESYERDYACSFIQPSSYVRGWGARSDSAEFVDYDLDDEDEDWLQQFNNERNILSPERFEWMLYKLEILDHKARERTGGMLATNGAPMFVVLQHDVAVEVLRSQSSRTTVLSAVYEYWKAKREQWQKPILRGLQPAPSVNDTNPFNVFRPREKAHRPHTRRMQRRENAVQSFKKLRQVHRNLEQARALLGMIQKREVKKREIVECELHLQRVQITMKHDSQIDDENLLRTISTVVTPNPRKSIPFKRDETIFSGQWSNFVVDTPDLINGHVNMRHSSEFTPPLSDGSVMLDHGDQLKLKGKPWRFPQPHGEALKRIAALDSFEPVMLFTKSLDPEKLDAAGIVPPLDPPLSNGSTQAPFCFRGRIGRGGRIVFDRWNPLTQMPLGGCNSFTSFSQSSSVTRFHPPPPRLNLEKTNASLSSIVVPDGNSEPTLNENPRTS
eukprot:c27981_g2_i1 orf=317-1837(-)